LFNYQQWLFIHRYAIRDIRRSYKKLWVIAITLFISLLLLSLTFSIKQSLNDEIKSNSVELLGGDVQINSGITPLSDERLLQLSKLGKVSQTVNFFTMLSKPGEGAVFTDLRSVDEHYPLYGVVQTEPAGAREKLLIETGAPAVLINENIQNQLQLKVGDELKIMSTIFVVGGVIVSVPDLTNSAAFGEFAIISKNEYDKFDLRTAGSFLHHDTRLKIPKSNDYDSIVDAVQSLLADDNNIRMKLPSDSVQSLRRIIDNFSNFLNLVSVSAMIIAGIGISNTLLSFINQRNTSIAIKKSLGFSSQTIQLIYFYEILVVLLSASIVAYAVGVLSPLVANLVIPASFGISLQPSFSLLDYANVAFIGLLVVLIFSIPSLYSIPSIEAAALFRNTFQSVNLHFSVKNIIYLLILAAILVAYFVLQTLQQALTLSYFFAFFVSMFIFYGVAKFLIFVLRRLPAFSNNTYKIAYRNIASKKSLAPIITISLGIGLTLLLTLSFVADNLKREIVQSIPPMAPDLFFISVNKNEKEPLESFIRTLDSDAIMEFNPMVSATFVALNAQPIESLVSRDNRSHWAIQGDRRISWSEEPPEDNLIIKGEWWSPGNSEQMLVSMDSRVAEDLGINVGDEITLSILGREVVGVIKNLRQVDYRGMGTNFAIIINTAFAQQLPFEYVGTLKSQISSGEIQSQVLRQFPNISAIKIDRILSKVGQIMNKIFIAVTSISLIVIVIGMIVIVSAVMVQTSLRKYNNLIYKILGVDFATILKAMTLEFAIIYLTLISFSISAAAFASYYVVENIFTLQWQLDWGLTLMLTASTGIVTFALILLANKNMFSPAVYPLIRNE
jgi:putative ABC transport system permease protein